MALETLGKKLPRNYFYLGQEHDFTAEAGVIYPIYQIMLFPGDYIEVENACLIRQMPTIAPSLSKFKVKFWDIVVAIRNLDKNFYKFLSQHEEYTSEIPWNEPLPRWIPSTAQVTRPGTLWDFLENPTDCIPDEDSCQLDYFRQAYGYIWDILFRNETRQDSILVKGEPGSWKGESLLRINWDKDYLTTSLPKQQLGDPLAIAISGIGSAQWNAEDIEINSNIPSLETAFASVNKMILTSSINNAETSDLNFYTKNQNVETNLANDTIQRQISIISNPNKNNILNALNKNTIDFKNAGSIYISTLREAIAHQSIAEINAMSGIRTNEFIEAHWGESPSTEALQYPEVFGKSEIDIITSEVLQTSESSKDSALGTMAGHGMGTGRGKKKKFYSKEFSIYLKLMYIKPNTIYGGQQAKREYTQKTIYDFPFPELDHISMQPIYGRELLCASTKCFDYNKTTNTLTINNITDDTAEKYNSSIKGFECNFAWYKEKLPRVSGLLKQEQFKSATLNEPTYLDNLYHWTEARFFKDMDGERPSINNDFLQCKLDNRNYAIVDDTIERSQFIVRHINRVDAWRTMSKKGLPSTLGLF